MTPAAAPSAFLSLLPLLAGAGFASGSGMRLLDPLLPLVATEFGTTVGAAAWLVAAFALAYGLGQVVVGPLGDRLGKLRVAGFALLAYAVSLAASAAAPDLAMLATIRAVSGAVAGAIIPLIMAEIGDRVPYAERQATIGKFLTGMVMAQLLAGPVSGVVGEFAGWRASFLVLGAFAGGIGLLLALRLGPAMWQAPPAGAGPGSLGLAGYLRILERPAGRRLLLAGFLDGALLFGGAFPFVGSFLIEQFGLSAGTAGLVVAGFGAGSFIYTRTARRLVNRFGERGLVLLGGGGLGLGLLGLALAPSWPMVAAAQWLLGLVFFMFHGVLQARATEALPEARGTAVSAFAMVLFLGQTVGALVFGAAITAFGYRWGFAGAGLAVAGLALWTRAVLLGGGTRGTAGG